MNYVDVSKGPGSNFYPAPIELPDLVKSSRNIVYASSEHYFHASKVAYCNLGTWEMFREIVAAETCMEAKRLGRAVPLDEDEIKEWDEYAGPIAMLEANLAKFRQNAECRRWLRGTKGRPLVEHRKDPRWGDNLDGTGLNLHGKILEVVRAVVVG